MNNGNLHNLARAFVAAAALVTIPAGALAQAEIGAAADQPQTGIKFGSGRLTPSFEFETRYDSMAGYVSDPGKEDLRAAGDVILHLKPGLHFVAPSESVELAARAVYDYNAYTGAEESELTDQSRSTMNLEAGALFNKEGDTRVEITDRFARSDRTSTLSLGAASISNRNDAALSVTTLSKGAWSITPSYTFTYEGFEAISGSDTADKLLEQYDYTAHTGRVDVRYKVFAQSALLLDAAVGQRSYLAEDARGDDVGNARVTVGLDGKLTQKIGYLLKVGYGTQFGLPDDAAEGFGSAIGGAELSWAPTLLSEVRAGYARGFEADPTYQFYANDRVYLNVASALNTRLRVRAGVAYDIVSFGADDDREDTVFSANIGPEYAFNRWFIGGVSYGYTDRSTDGTANSALSPFLDYDRHEVAARVTFIY